MVTVTAECIAQATATSVLNSCSGGYDDYKYRKNIDGKYTEEKGKSLLEALKDEEWDYIVFQQASSFAGQYSSYFPELKELISVTEVGRSMAK